MTLLRWASLALCLTLSSFSFAESGFPKTELKDLAQCYQAALIRSEFISNQEQLVVQAEERVRQTVGSILPSITGSGYRTWQEAPQSAVGGALFPSLQDQLRLSATQPLFRGFREFAALKQAKGLKRAQDQAERQAQISLYRDVAQAFYSVISLEQDLENIRSQIRLYQQRVSELRERIRIGRSRVSEALTIEASATSLKAQADSIKGQAEVARETLAFLTGFARDIALKDEEVEALTYRLPQVSKYLDRLELRPDVKSDLERAAAADHAIWVAKGAHLPSADLSGNYYFIRPGALQNVHWDVQLSFSLPIYQGGVIQSQVRTAQSLKDQADLVVSQTRRRADQEIRSLYETVRADQEQIKSLEMASRISERNYSDQSKEYRLGLVTNLDVLQALTSSQESKRALARARYVFKNDLAQLESAAVMRPAGKEE